ncbi:hypothetical protein F5050DRAFT_1789537 [Lentinula boryana]|uniref:Uncharacterized protein n=1 Tax=Lentinula boryana TaxID=40481 RepID=A0ABQ8Q0Y6_9AGAR|nr:hypothetical protein F5050DRAFT_1789537 [Lentinula boryana]
MPYCYRLITAVAFILSILSSHIVNGVPIAAIDSLVLRSHIPGTTFELSKSQNSTTVSVVYYHKAVATGTTIFLVNINILIKTYLVLTTHAFNKGSQAFVNLSHNIVRGARGARITIDAQIYIRVPILIFFIFIMLFLVNLRFTSEDEDEDDSEDFTTVVEKKEPLTSGYKELQPDSSDP